MNVKVPTLMFGCGSRLESCSFSKNKKQKRRLRNQKGKKTS